MTATVTHTPKAGATLTGAEYESATHHVVAIPHADTTGQTATDHHPAPAAGPDANISVDTAGAAGTASTFARSGHGHQVVTDSGVASTQAFGDAATAGTSGTIQRGGHKHAMPADPVTAHVAASDPHTGYVLETLFDAKGDLISASADNTPAKVTVGADDTILMADAAAAAGLKWVAAAIPVTQAFGDVAAAGTSDTFTRGDHRHGMPAAPAAAVSFTAFTQDLGVARRTGTFDLTGLSGLTVDKPVQIMQTAAQIASKGNARDEPEMDQIQFTGYVVDATVSALGSWPLAP